MRRQIIVVTATLLIAVLLAAIIAGSVLTSPRQEDIGSLPDDLNGSSVQFQSNSGSTIHGWYIPGQRGAGAVVLMHGVRGNRLSMLDRARFLSRDGYSVLLFDFQAHGESQGKHITFGYLESEDAKAAVDFVKNAAPGEHVGVIGVSMGGAATLLSNPPLNVEAIVIEMVYPTINDAVDDRLVTRLGGWAKVLSPLLLLQLKPRLGIGANELRPIDHVSQLTMPKLFIAGANDKHTTAAESKRLFETAAAPKEFWLVPGGGHVDLHNVARVEYEQRILDFFKRTLR